MWSELDVLKASFDDEKSSNTTAIALRYPAWAVSVALNTLTGKELKDWGFLIASMQILNRYGGEKYVHRLACCAERQPLPWPVQALEETYSQCKLSVRRLSNAWMQAAPRDPEVKHGFIGSDPSEEFWSACETAINPRFETAIRFFLPEVVETSQLYLNRLVSHIINCPKKEKGACVKAISDLARDKRYEDSSNIAKLMTVLATWSVGAHMAFKITEPRNYPDEEPFTSIFRQ
jgi:hypothetical protein